MLRRAMSVAASAVAAALNRISAACSRADKPARGSVSGALLCSPGTGCAAMVNRDAGGTGRRLASSGWSSSAVCASRMRRARGPSGKLLMLSSASRTHRRSSAHTDCVSSGVITTCCGFPAFRRASNLLAQSACSARALRFASLRSLVFKERRTAHALGKW